MKKFIDILNSDCIILEKLNKHNNEYYMEINVFKSNKRIKLEEVKSKIRYSEYILFNEDLLNNTINLKLESDKAMLFFDKNNKVIKYPGLFKENELFMITLHFSLLNSNDINLIKTYAKITES